MHPLLFEGLTDAVGFVAGVLVAWFVGRLFGFDPLAPGYGGSAIGGILVAGIGGGVGLQLARRWRASTATSPTRSSSTPALGSAPPGSSARFARGRSRWSTPSDPAFSRPGPCWPSCPGSPAH